MKIAPRDYFQLPGIDGEETDGEEVEYQANPISFTVNADFRGNALEDLARSDGRHWVHCKSRDVLYFEESSFD